MITLRWTGRTVSVNRWHVVRGGRISPSREYEEFVESLAWAFLAGSDGRTRAACDISIHCKLRPRIDKQNVLKPVLDALVRAKVITDDRDQIGHIHILPAERVKKGEEEILVWDDWSVWQRT